MSVSLLANLWEETAVPPPVVEPLEGSVRAAVLVVGAGYLGLSAALHIAEVGGDVVVLEAETPGFGASGRNGGQLIPGLKYDPDAIEAKFGRERGERLWRFAGGTADFVFGLVERLGLEAQARRTAWIQGIHSQRAAGLARSRAEQWQRRGADVAYVEAAEAERLTGTGIYVGAFVDRRAGCIQPLSYARELARAAIAAGARLHGQSRVVSLARRGGAWIATTASGAQVTAGTVLLCANAYADGLVPELPRSIVAATSLQIATEPLPETLRSLILPGGEVLSDTRKVIRYWRLDAEGRLLMGGRGPYREPGPESDWAHLKREVGKLYPALRGIGFTHRWGGRVAIHPDYWPRLHRPQSGLVAAIGCQGRGIGWQTAIGFELARLTQDEAYRPVLPISPIVPIPFSPLKRVGVAATVAAMRALDRLGLS
ncbi:Glycine/D-amino acid oxidase [Rhizobiales bacterium GAS188]|nr:Glycine/D-amino acid oxidase [Rhizobiales bacterium GAS188]